jgi:hypothetical protein
MASSTVSSNDVQRDKSVKKIDARPKRKINIPNSENGWYKGLDVHNLILTGKYGWTSAIVGLLRID